VVFLVKQYIGSEVLIQAPEICFPFAGLEYLPQEEFPLSPGKSASPGAAVATAVSGVLENGAARVGTSLGVASCCVLPANVSVRQ